jgi:hypothetical protein
MQKVEGSNPFSRFGKGLHLQVFSAAQSAGAFASTGTQWAPGAPTLGGAVSEQTRLQAFIDDSND